MAKNKCLVYLGYEDEFINEKTKAFVDFTTNKVGGDPIWPYSEISVPPCPICGLKRLLVIQIYAPLENSQFHRTLYVFSCLNPVCSNRSESWICIRSQIIEKQFEKEINKKVNKSNINRNNALWCAESDVWDDVENQMSISDTDDHDEENGNIINNENNNKISDDDETNSIEYDPIPLFGNLQVDEKNANCGIQGEGAVGRINSPNPSAEIEGAESEVVCIETPSIPQRDLIALFKQTPAIPRNLDNINIKSFFISVDEERSQENSEINEHIRDLIQEYQARDNCAHTPESPVNLASGGCNIGNFENAQEQYEKSTPAHGDLMFHNFLTRIQENPGQIIRYSRNSTPLLIHPLLDKIPKCMYCGGEVLCEIQILPTLIPKLQLNNDDSCPIEYGNVLVFTCIKSCWDTPDKYRTEYVLVQSEI